MKDKKILLNFYKNIIAIAIMTLIIALIEFTTVLPTVLIVIYFMNNKILGILIGLAFLIMSLAVWCSIYDAFIEKNKMSE